MAILFLYTIELLISEAHPEHEFEHLFARSLKSSKYTIRSSTTHSIPSAQHGSMPNLSASYLALQASWFEQRPEKFQAV
jgi:hypothetical protein